MRLVDLEPKLLRFEERIEGGRTHQYHHKVRDISEAQGIMFLCPKCYRSNGGAIGTHSVICWSPSVPQHAQPRPGRWNLQGTSLDDLSLVAGSSSVQLLGGCAWHGFVTNGEVRDA